MHFVSVDRLTICRICPNVGMTGAFVLAVVFGLTAVCCDGISASSKSGTASSRVEYERQASVDSNGVPIRIDYFLGKEMRESVWYLSGWPIMRTVWSEDGYGHSYEFALDGRIKSISECLSGSKCYRNLSFDTNHLSVDSSWATLISSASQSPAAGSSSAEVPTLQIEEHMDLTGNLLSREYSNNGQVIETRWYDLDGKAVFRSLYDSSGYGHSIFWSNERTIRMITEVRYGVANGMAIVLDGNQIVESRIYVDGIMLISRKVGVVASESIEGENNSASER